MCVKRDVGMERDLYGTYVVTSHHAEAHCSTLQHTATRCNTLQHTKGDLYGTYVVITQRLYM